MRAEKHYEENAADSGCRADIMSMEKVGGNGVCDMCDGVRIARRRRSGR